MIAYSTKSGWVCASGNVSCARQVARARWNDKPLCNGIASGCYRKLVNILQAVVTASFIEACNVRRASVGAGSAAFITPRGLS